MVSWLPHLLHRFQNALSAYPVTPVGPQIDSSRKCSELSTIFLFCWLFFFSFLFLSRAGVFVKPLTMVQPMQMQIENTSEAENKTIKNRSCEYQTHISTQIILHWIECFYSRRLLHLSSGKCVGAAEFAAYSESTSQSSHVHTRN